MDAQRTPLSRDSIVETALMLADQNGPEALSMRKIAGALGVKAMSLYNHVRNKEEILEALVERVVGEIELPTIDGDWKAAMRTRGRSAYEVLRRHPWAIMLILTSANAGPMMLRYVDATLGCLRTAGFSYEIADHAWHTMDNHIYGFTLQEVNFPFETSEYTDTAREFMPAVDTEQVPYFAELATLIMEGRYPGIHDLEFGLNLILDGLERYL
jgi:AcrR family transcriptional regulator